MEAADVTPLSASGIEPYDTLVFSIFDGPAPDLSPDSLIPTGTVSYRIRQLHGIIPQDRRPSKHPLFERDRENMLIGWGRRSARHTVKPEHSYTGLKIARWEDNDIHGYSQEIHHEHDHEHDFYEPTCIACTSNPAHVYSPPPQLRELELDLELPILTNNSNQMDDSKLKRKSARDLYQEYGISRPPGWLSDEEDSDLARSGDGSHSPPTCCHVCHVCAYRTSAPSKCTSCGHHFCQRYICERQDEVVRISDHYSEQKVNDQDNEIHSQQEARHIIKGEYDADVRSVQRPDSSSNARSANSTIKGADVHHSTQKGDHSMAQIESNAYKSDCRNLRQNPFLMADRDSARKTVTPKQSNIVASRHDSPSRNVLSPELGKTILSGNGQEHISSRLDDVHMEREDNHRHHLVSLHGTPHVAEHLVDRFRNKLQNWSARHSPKLSKSTTPVHAIAEVSHHEYVEETMLSGSPTHKELNGSITLPNDHTRHGQLSPLAAPVIQREFHKLRHVDSGAFERHASRTELDQLRHLARSRTTDSTSTQIHTVQRPHVVDHQDSLSGSGANGIEHGVRRYESAEF